MIPITSIYSAIRLVYIWETDFYNSWLMFGTLITWLSGSGIGDCNPDDMGGNRPTSYMYIFKQCCNRTHCANRDITHGMYCITNKITYNQMGCSFMKQHAHCGQTLNKYVIMMLMKFSDLSQWDRSNWVMWQVKDPCPRPGWDGCLTREKWIS